MATFRDIGILPKDSVHIEEAEQLFTEIAEISHNTDEMPLYQLIAALIQLRTLSSSEDTFMEHLRELREKYKHLE